MVGETGLIEGSIPSSQFDSEAEDDTDLGNETPPINVARETPPLC